MDLQRLDRQEMEMKAWLLIKGFGVYVRMKRMSVPASRSEVDWLVKRM